MHPKQQFIKDIYGKYPETLDEVAESVIAVLSQTLAPVLGFAWDIRYNKKISNSHNAPIAGHTNFSSRGRNNKDLHYPGFSGRVWIRFAKGPDFFGMSREFSDTLTHTGTGGGGSYDGLWTAISTASYNTRKRVNSDSIHTKYIYKYPELECYSWDYKIFLSDFPGIAAPISPAEVAHELEEDRKRTWAKIKGTYYHPKTFVYKHHFEYEDPIVKAADEAFLEQYINKEFV